MNAAEITPLPTPLPTITLSLEEEWAWPLPQFARPGTMSPLPAASALPCRVESSGGVTFEGELMDFDVARERMRVRVGRDGDAMWMPFSRLRRLTVLKPWTPLRPAPGVPQERLPAAAQDRDYSAALSAGGHLAGRSMGHVRQRCGWFLFAPADGGHAVLRQFVPAATCTALSFGKSTEELAAERWVATPEQLLAAVQAQQQATIRPLGESLRELGLASEHELERVARIQAQGGHEQPLGEALVSAGLISSADLQTALAHKMGYPVVDLLRFPIDPKAVQRLSSAVMQEHRALPLMQDGNRLFVAVDSLGSVATLKALQSVAGLDVVPVIAPRGRLSVALAAHQKTRDVWATNVVSA
jgi:Type II secretion system (T2SS), protein E, N-terminal domain